MVSGFSDYCHGFCLLVCGKVHLQIWKGQAFKGDAALSQFVLDKLKLYASILKDCNFIVMLVFVGMCSG